MASADQHDLPVYALTDLPRSCLHVALVPADRWRVVIRQVEPLERDILLETVIRLRDAGQTSPSRIADLLQVPVDLVLHLLARIVGERLSATSTGDLRSESTKVTWVYRDRRTDELWPESAAESSPLTVHYPTQGTAVYETGTAGRPIRITCLLLPTDDRAPTEPTSLELARFSRVSSDPRQRTSVVSTGERCLVMSPVVRTEHNAFILTSLGTPHVGLTRAIDRLAAEDRVIGKWLKSVPVSERLAARDDSRSPLQRAVGDLREAHAEWGAARTPDLSTHLLARMELALSRYCDERWYTSHLDPLAEATNPPSKEFLQVRVGLAAQEADLLLAAQHGSVEDAVLQLIGASGGVDDEASSLQKLAKVTARWAATARYRASIPLDQLAADILNLCTTFLDTIEVPHGVQG